MQDINELKQKKDDQKLDNLKVYVVDVESTGLDGHPRDLTLTIGIAEVDVINQTVDPFYNKIIGYDTNEWDIWKKDSWIFDNSPLELEQIQHAYDNGQTLEVVAKELNELMNKKFIAFYNKAFDYNKFLMHAPFIIDPMNVLPCLMLAATEPAAIPNRFYPGMKWPSLEESVDILLNDEIKKDLLVSESFHDASYDAYVSGFVMLSLIENGHYNLTKYLNL